MSAERRSLPLARLTRAAFAPYGELIDAAGVEPQVVNAGTALRFAPLAGVQLVGGSPSAAAVIGIYRAQPRALPLPLRELERHPLASQAFVPLAPGRYLVVVAGSAPEPVAADVRVFVASGQQGVNLRAGVWHHALLALDRESEFLVVERASAEGNLDTWATPDWGLWIDG